MIKIISVVIENWTVERPPLQSHQAYTSKLGLHAIYEFFKLYIVYIDTQAPPDAIMGRRLGIQCYHYMCMGLDMAEALLAPKTNLHGHIICIVTINLSSFAKPFIVSAELMSYHIANTQSSS